MNATPERFRRAAKLTVVGTGLVGSTAAYSILARGLVSEIVLIDINRQRAEGEAMDLNHAAPFGRPVRVRAGDYPDAEGSDIIVVAAGAAQKAGESRLSLAKTNVEIIRQIAPTLHEAAPEAIVLIVSNPVDILTYAAQKVSGYPVERVIGSGTLLDTGRFRFELANRCQVAPANVHAYIIGEHGDTEVPVWSLANIAGMRLRDYCPICGKGCDARDLNRLFENVKNAAYEVIARKGATYYAIALGVTRLAEAILRDENAVMTVSTLVDGYYGIRDVCLSLPTVVCRQGIREVIPLKMTDAEVEALRHSAETLRNVLASVGL